MDAQTWQDRSKAMVASHHHTHTPHHTHTHTIVRVSEEEANFMRRNREREREREMENERERHKQERNFLERRLVLAEEKLRCLRLLAAIANIISIAAAFSAAPNMPMRCSREWGQHPAVGPFIVYG